ncbi:MAG: membrane protein insertase YidC [Parachlamydiaceae bacterium]|nr:membrane protein insertase YidC [Parachlamydiaceae bacterium]
MDKRTLLFIVAVSLTLFGVNIFFQHQGAQKKQEWINQQKIKESIKAKKLEEEISQKTVPLKSLPITNIYSTANLDNLIASGVISKGQLLTLSWTQEIPKTVYTKDPNSDKVEEYNLAFHQEGLGSLVLYKKNKESLTIPALSSTGDYDLQLVSFNSPHAEDRVHVTLAEYKNGQLAVLGSNLKEIDNTNKKFIAIALLKTSEGFVPVAVYDPHSQELVLLNEIQELAPNISSKTPAKATPTPSSKKSEEKFYVLENEYQQLVFSNFGGALAEINLPFRNEKNQYSVVREIGFDREMVENHPYNAMFPAHPYYTPSANDNNLAFEWHEKGTLGGYYPLIRRDLIETGKRQSIRVKPNYYAFNIISDFPELAELEYEVKNFTSNSITFEASQNYRRITKIYSFGDTPQEGLYCVNLEIRIDGDSKGLWLTSGVPEVEWISGAPAPVMKYRITRNKKAEVENIDLPKESATISSIFPDWICNSNGFLGTIMDPLTEIDPGFRVQFVPGTTVPSRLVEIEQDYNRFKAENLPGYMTLLPLKSKGGTMKFRFFAGPFDGDILKKIDANYADPATGYNPDYIACQTMHGWFTFISEPFAKFLLILMKFFHYVTNSWALSIVLLTASLRVILYPLNAWSTKSMVKMQLIAPEVTTIQEKHKKDPKKAQTEIMALYRDRGINPASGCLPLLIQMPFLIGMFDLLKSSFALRGAPFIPGWIDDLTAPDVLFRWDYPVFFFGNEFHLLPIILGFVMFIQQRFFSATPTDPKMMTDQQRQQKAMGSMMAVVFAVMFYNFPSGLNIYWLSSMLLGMLQQWYTTKQLKSKATTFAPKKAVLKK